MLADSTFIIDLLHGDNGAIKILREKDYALFTTEINVFEIIAGVYAIKKDMQPQLDMALALFSQMIVLPLDRKASLRAGEIAGELIKNGFKIGDCDSLIAGIALSNGVSRIITKNTKHFGRIKELNIINY